MAFLAFVTLAAGGLFFVSALYENHGYAWADETCASMPSLCEISYYCSHCRHRRCPHSICRSYDKIVIGAASNRECHCGAAIKLASSIKFQMIRRRADFQISILRYWRHRIFFVGF